MAYCVHCGVRLGADVTECPLCGTAVYDPKAENRPSERAWPEQEDRFPPRKLNWPFLSRLVLLGLALVACVTVLCDLITTGRAGWSWYVVGMAAFLAGISAAPVFSRTGTRAFAAWAGLEGMLLIIAWRCDGFRWFLLLALPFGSIATACGLVCLRLSAQKRLHLLHRLALSLGASYAPWSPSGS